MESGKRVAVFFALICILCGPMASGQTSIDNIRHQPGAAGRYGKIEITFDLGESYANPYDTDEVDVRVEFVPPGGSAAVIPAFWYQGYDRSTSGGEERYTFNGVETWMARLMAREPGACRYRILVSDRNGSATSEWNQFGCADTRGRGMIRVDDRNPRYLRYESGEPYLPVGHNLCWPGGGGAERLTRWLDRMAEVGENWTRYWMVPFVGQGIEWRSGGFYQGLGRYSQQISCRFDAMVDAANDRGVAVQFCMDSFNGWNYSVWANWTGNPYNVSNGGFLSRPIDYLSNPTAKTYARKRFRYIVARWADSPGILCWEFWNEADIIGAGGTAEEFYRTPENRALGAQWHQEMARYLESLDPYDHLITTSFSNDPDPLRYPEIWELPEMDIVQCHRYTDFSPEEHISLIEQGKAYPKPVILGEFGLEDVPSPWKPDGLLDGALLMPKPWGDDVSMKINYVDANGQTLHNVIWPAAMAESGGMSWWWDNWIDPAFLYPVFRPLTTYLRWEDWAPLHLVDLEATVTSGHSVDIYGLQNGDFAFLWIRDPAGSIVSGLTLRIDGLNDLPKMVEYWNTYTSAVARRGPFDPVSGSLDLSVQSFSRDVAVKVKPAGISTGGWTLR